MIHFGFSYVGLVFLLMLMIPNMLWTKHQPKDYEKYVVNERKSFLILERTGEVMVSALALIFSDFNLRAWTLWSMWLFLGFLAMVLYEIYWIRYFKSEKTMKDFYSSICGVPVAGATLPIIAFFCLGIYGINSFLLVAVVILGIGHIGIHLDHKKEVYAEETNAKINTTESRWKRVIYCILKVIFWILLITIVTVSIVLTGERNYQWIKGAARGENSIDEDVFIPVNGQEQYCLIRGNDTSNPVIIWIHGGPASPDTMDMFFLSNYLKDEYTFIAYNQRGSGRTYYKNKKQDPENETATFDQLQEDLDVLVDYARKRFNQEKVIIVGHSFGTMVGSKYAINHPDKVSYYVGAGQMGGLDSSNYAAEDALEKAKASGDDYSALEQAVKAYEKEASVENLLAYRKLAYKYHKEEYSHNYILDILVSPYLGVDDVRWFLNQLHPNKFVGMNKKLFEYIEEEDIYNFGTSFEMSVGFISGSCDWSTPVKCTKDYYETITAPKKSMELIEGWGHCVPMENPKEFARALKTMLSDMEEQE